MPNQKMMSNKILFLIILFLSLAVAGLLLIGSIDPDFFSYYYVGRGVVDGHDMFRDFADNKGPVLYGFFAVLYFIFRENFQLAVFFGNGIVDAVSIFFLFRILGLYGLDLRRINIFNVSFILLSVLLYKSFSITYFMGSVYAEQLAMMFFLISLWQFENKKSFSSGIFFALSFLSRLSFLFFIVVFPSLVLIRKLKKSSFYYFSFGLLTCAGLILSYFVATGSIDDFVNNSVFYSLQNSEATSNIRFPNLFTVSILETRILLIFLIVTFFVAISPFALKDKKLSAFLVILYLTSSIVTNPGGIFYSHHFLQFMVITFIIFAFFRSKMLKTLPILAIMMVFIVGNYVIYLSIPRQSFAPSIQEVSDAEYLKVVSYYPKFYFTFDKKAPDRNYHSFYLSDSFNKNSAEDVKRHKALNKDKLKKTIFMMVEFSEGDKQMNAEYLQKFGSAFHLVKKKVYQYENGKVELYSSRL